MTQMQICEFFLMQTFFFLHTQMGKSHKFLNSKNVNVQKHFFKQIIRRIHFRTLHV